MPRPPRPSHRADVPRNELEDLKEREKELHAARELHDMRSALDPQAPVIASGGGAIECGYFYSDVRLEPNSSSSYMPLKLRAIVSGDLAWTIENGELTFPPGTYRVDLKSTGNIQWPNPQPTEEDFVPLPSTDISIRNGVDGYFFFDGDSRPSRTRRLESAFGVAWFAEPGGIDLSGRSTFDYRVGYQADMLITRLGDFNGEFQYLTGLPPGDTIQTTIFSYQPFSGYAGDARGVEVAAVRVGMAWDVADDKLWTATHVVLQPSVAVSDVHVYLYDGGASGNVPTNLVGHGTPPGKLVAGDRNQIPLDTPVPIVSGRKYFVVAYLPNGGYIYKEHVFDSAVPSVYDDLTSLRALDSASVSPGNGFVFEGAVTNPANPDNPTWTSVNNTHYGIDVLLTDNP